MDCIFCKIAAGEIPSKKVYADELCYAFWDIAPKAPAHVLVVPREHIPGLDGVTPENSAVVAHIFEVIPKIAAGLGLKGGYRVVSTRDRRADGFHLHFHILAGRKLSDDMA